MKIWPEVGSISRLIMRSTVDLPQPDGPISTTSSPALTDRLSLSTATVPSGYCLRTSRSSIGAALRSAGALLPPSGVASTHVPPRPGVSGCRQSLVLLGLHPDQLEHHP